MFIPVVIGSLRSGRNTPRLAHYLHAQLVGMAGVESELFDPREMALPILEERLKFLDDPPAALVRFGAAIDRARGVVIVTPEYNKGYPAALKNIVDGLSSEWRRKPVAIATHSTGAFGGSVVLQALRPVMMGLGAVPIPGTLSVPHITQAFGEGGELLDEVFAGRCERFLDELLHYAEALAPGAAD